jgi:hypothetical protein
MLELLSFELGWLNAGSPNYGTHPHNFFGLEPFRFLQSTLY